MREGAHAVSWPLVALYALVHAALLAALERAESAHPFFEWSLLAAAAVLTYAELTLFSRRAAVLAPLHASWLGALLLASVWRAHWVHHAAPLVDLVHPVVRAAHGVALFALALVLGVPLAQRPDLAPVLVGAAVVARLAVPPLAPPPLAVALLQSAAHDALAALFCAFAQWRDDDAFARVAPLACVAAGAWLACAHAPFSLLVGAALEALLLGTYMAKAARGAPLPVAAPIAAPAPAPIAAPAPAPLPAPPASALPPRIPVAAAAAAQMFALPPRGAWAPHGKAASQMTGEERERRLAEMERLEKAEKARRAAVK
jgi:hypothetical protein